MFRWIEINNFMEFIELNNWKSKRNTHFKSDILENYGCPAKNCYDMAELPPVTQLDERLLLNLSHSHTSIPTTDDGEYFHIFQEF